jgi:RDD family.
MAMKKDSKVDNTIPAESELSELDTGAFRRMRLDPSQSYGMNVKRPTGEMSGNYAILSAPSEICEEGAKKSVPLCDTCGAKIEDLRLSCKSCGNYLNSGVRQSSWDKLRTESRTRSVLAIETPAQITCRELMLKRVMAAAIDSAIVGTVLFIAGFSYFRYVFATIGAEPELEPLLVSISYYVLPIAGLISFALYNASFESSPVMATLGNMIVGLTLSKCSGEGAYGQW